MIVALSIDTAGPVESTQPADRVSRAPKDVTQMVGTAPGAT